jgi:hypothetical protein
MYLVAPDILADACGLSLGLILLAVPVGLVLWLLGWWSHRFWVVLLTTVVAGVYGLHVAPAFQAPALLAGLLLALAAGVLALALVRLVAFAGGGLVGLLLMQAIYPSLNQPLITFLIAGLVSLLLFRPCIMVLTSLSGAVLLTCAALMLLNYYAVLDAPAWSEQSPVLLNAIAGSLAFVGVVVQFLLDRYVFRKKSEGRSWLAELWALLPTREAHGGGRVPTARRAAFRE